MKTQKIASAISAIAFASLLVAGTASAHSAHDHSHLPVGWTFDKQVTNKIQKNLEQGHKKTGLSSQEQKILGQYGIGIGNSFNTRVDGQTLKVTRTDSGIRVEGQIKMYADGLQENLPIRENAEVARSSFSQNHTGHDHSHLKMSWVFNPAIEEKIHDALVTERAHRAIGLTSGEQRVLERYEIKIGNSFYTYVDGKTFTAKRTSMGLRIMNEVDGRTVASAPGAGSGSY
ncbi:MAG: hypothetical protein G3M70_10395 [Candidatus Nitronauta litoralis]|uniref:Uncharacterized protein n=1 Tax=Candidatus Nitronauta litoralis TaxID=2705533 RepID=A0A7T0BWN3_9BACT|nr:MAG: hypothetical protein G3M70_10395 [Candidatus Nitronauta litoralis]